VIYDLDRDRRILKVNAIGHRKEIYR